MLICDKCTSEIPSGSKFCPNCADPVTAADEWEGQERAKLVCPKCTAQNLYNAAAGANDLTCPSCKTTFCTVIATVRAKRSRGMKSENRREFSVRVVHHDGDEELVEFVRQGIDDFELRSKDVVAFTTWKRQLWVVQNMTVSRYMELQSRTNWGCVLAVVIVAACIVGYMLFK